MRPASGIGIRKASCLEKMAFSIISNHEHQEHQSLYQFPCVFLRDFPVSLLSPLHSVYLVPTTVFFFHRIASSFSFSPSASKQIHRNAFHNCNRSHHPPCSIIRRARSSSWTAKRGRCCRRRSPKWRTHSQHLRLSSCGLSGCELPRELGIGLF